MGQALSRVCPISMSRLFVMALVYSFISAPASAQSSKPALPTTSSFPFTRALRLAQSGHCEEAIPILKKSLLPGRDSDMRRGAGLAGIRCAMVLNQSEAAIEFLRMLNREFPRDPEVLYVSVHTYSDLSTRAAQQLDEAIQHFSRAAKLDAGFGDAFLGLGSSLMSQRKFSEAVPPLETAVKLEPQNPVAHYNLAMAYARSGRKEAADKEFALHREMMQKSGGPGADQGSTPPEAPQ